MAKANYTIKCALCGGQFTRRSNRQRFCSKQCFAVHRADYKKRLDAKRPRGKKQTVCTCSTCGVQFLRLPGQGYKWCSDPCKPLGHRDWWKQVRHVCFCSACSEPYVPLCSSARRPSIYCSKECGHRAKDKRRRVIRECACCGKEYTSSTHNPHGNKQIFCSLRCYQVHQRRGKEARWLQENQGAFSPVFYKTCRECGDNLGARPAALQEFCGSSDCARSRQARHSWAISHGVDDVYSDECREAYAEGLKYRPCETCGCHFKKKTWTLTDECERCCKKRHRRMRRHRIRAERRNVPSEKYCPINDVIVRDGERCYLCGIETPLSLRGTLDPQAPEIDHIWPLARGGPDTLDNVACACRNCNRAKSDGVISALQPRQVVPEVVTSKEQIKTARKLFIEPNVTRELSDKINLGGYGSVAFWLKEFEVGNGTTQTTT